MPSKQPHQTRSQLSASARAYAAAALAPNTERAYRTQWRLWTEYAHSIGREGLPADPIDVANWLAARAAHEATAIERRPARRATVVPTVAMTIHRERPLEDIADCLAAFSAGVGDGRTLATLRTALAAIRFAHLARGQSFDTAHPAIALVLRGVARTQRVPPRQAKPLTPDIIAGLLQTVSDEPRPCRDAALVALGYCFARRRSELTGLDLDALGTGTGVLSLDGANLTVRQHRAKTQTPQTDEVFVVPKSVNRLAVDAIKRWIAMANIVPGEPVLRRVYKSGKISKDRLDPQSIALILKARLKSYYEEQGLSADAAVVAAKKYSGHSLRVGFAVASAEAGASVLAIQGALGHKSPAMAARYAAAAEKARTSPHLLLGVAIGSKNSRPRRVRINRRLRPKRGPQAAR